MVLQDGSRRALSTGFAREEDDARGAEHRNESTAIFSPYRTMRYGVVIAFLASSLVHGDLLAHVIARANAIRQLLQYGSPAGSQQARLLFKNKRLGLTAIWVLERPGREQCAAFKTAAEPTRFQIKGYCGGALRYVNWLTSAQNVSLPVCRLSAVLRHGDRSDDVRFQRKTGSSRPTNQNDANDPQPVG